MIFLYNNYKDYCILAEVEVVRNGVNLTREIKILDLIHCNCNDEHAGDTKHVNEEFLYSDYKKLIDHLFLMELS